MPVASASSNEEEGGACHGAAVGRQGGLSRVGGGVRRELDETPRIGEVHVHLQEIEEREVEGRRSKGGRDRTGGARSEERRRGEARRGDREITLPSYRLLRGSHTTCGCHTCAQP